MATVINDTETGLYLSYDAQTDVVIWVTFDHAHRFENPTDASIVLSSLNSGNTLRYVGRPGDRQPKP